MKFQVDCYPAWTDTDTRPRRMTEAQVVAHVARCGNGHAIIRDGEPYFVVGGAS